MPAPHVPVATDHVVTVDDAGRRLGTFERARVHSAETPLHLAFSCYVLNDADELLVTRRALTKRTWPGVWTNSFCGHPRWAEDTEDSVVRHAEHELGLTIRDLRLVVPGFRYRAVDAAGIVENEICPVYVARADSELSPSSEEVMDWTWTPVASLVQAVTAAPWAFSPWMVMQLEALRAADFADGEFGVGQTD